MALSLTSGTLFTMASITSNTIPAPSPASVDVSGHYTLDVLVRIGRATGTAFTAAPVLRVQGTKETSPTANSWIDLCAFSPPVGASIASQAVSGTEAAGETTITLAAGTNFAAGDFVFFHNTTLANSEWKRVVSVTGADIVVHDAIVNAQTGSTCRDQAEEWTASLAAYMPGLTKIRLLPDANNTGQAFILEAFYSGATSL